MTRTPPICVRRCLRGEVGFGCPVEGCGSPYLTYHHFDPPWHARQDHNPEGIIALCLAHHCQADQGTFTSDQLRQMKRTPYLKQLKEPPRGYFNWKRELLLSRVGRMWGIECDVPLTIAGEKVIWISKTEEGHSKLNLEIRDSNGNQLFSMRDNDWLFYAPVNDIYCKPSGIALEFKEKIEGISMRISFQHVERQQLRQQLHDWLHLSSEPDPIFEKFFDVVWDKVQERIGDRSIALVDLEARLVWPYEVVIDKTGMTSNGRAIGVVSGYQIGVGGVTLQLG